MSKRFIEPVIRCYEIYTTIYDQFYYFGKELSRLFCLTAITLFQMKMLQLST